jgi:hypothetical protein
VTHRRLLHLRRASGCFGTSRGLSSDSSSTTSPRAGSSSTTSPTSRVRVPRHVARLVTWLVVDYFTYAARPVPSARRAACRMTRRRLHRLAQARCRLLRLHCASGCLGTSRDSSSTTSPRAGSSSTTSPMPRVRVPRHVARLVAPLVVDYFAYVVHPGASAHRAARRRLLRLRRASGCLGTSRLLVSRQHWLYFKYATRRRDVIFRSHRVDHSCRLVFQTSRERLSHPQQLIRINSD